MIVRCRVCQELLLPAIEGNENTAFLSLLEDCSLHTAVRHAELFSQISAVAGQIVASLALELFETQDLEVARNAAGLRSLAVDAVRQSQYSELKGKFELRASEMKIETVTENVTFLG